MPFYNSSSCNDYYYNNNGIGMYVMVTGQVMPSAIGNTLGNGIQYAHDGECAVILVVRGCVLM